MFFRVPNDIGWRFNRPGVTYFLLLEQKWRLPVGHREQRRTIESHRAVVVGEMGAQTIEHGKPRGQLGRVKHVVGLPIGVLFDQGRSGVHNPPKARSRKSKCLTATREAGAT